MTKRVAILGAGPVSAYVYSACVDRGIFPTIVAESITKSPYGAFWFRWIPKFLSHTFAPEKIEILSYGDKETYISKQWGKDLDPDLYPSSFPESKIEAWGYDPSIILAKLWRNAKVTKRPITDDEDIWSLAKIFDCIFLTFPSFESRRINAHYTVEVPTIRVKNSFPVSNKVYYDGGEGKIVRVSFLFGNIYYELVKDCEYNLPGEYGKFIDLHPSTPAWTNQIEKNVFYIGRYAEWNRHMLAHEAYEKAINILEQL